MVLQDWGKVSFDYDDERYVRRLKRKLIDTKGFKVRDSKSNRKKNSKEDHQLRDGLVDNDYKKFVMHVHDKSNDDDLDPQYMVFLQHLKRDGKSYILKVAKSNGMSAFIKYEDEDELNDNCKSYTRKRLRSDADERSAKAREVFRSEPVNPIHCETNGCPSQKHKSDSQLHAEFDPSARKKQRKAKKQDKVETACKLRNVPRKDNLEKQKNLRNSQRKEREIEKGSSPELPNLVSRGKSKCSSWKFTPQESNKSERQQRCFSAKFDMVDEDYQLFLNGAKTEGCYLIFESAYGKVRFEDDSLERSSDSEIFVTEDAQAWNEVNDDRLATPREFDASISGDDCKCLGPIEKVHSQFRRKLMAILRKAYNQKEYDKLFQDANVKNPLGGDVHLRTGTKRYSANKYGKSYLDHHDDLKRKLEAVRDDKCKALNILRGFFFWLQNLAHEGAFIPWKDQSCLEVLPAASR